MGLGLGYQHSCALLSSGEVACWGRNDYGQLGDGTRDDRSMPVTVFGLEDAVAIVAGSTNTCALRSDRSVVCWGAAAWGALGDPTATADALVPVAVPGLAGVVRLTAGIGQLCALLGTGNVVCWGDNAYGEVGTGTDAAIVAEPTPLSLSDVVFVQAGVERSCAIRALGAASCWGAAWAGRSSDVRTPEDIVGLDSAADIQSGFSTICALRTTHDITCWGGGAYGTNGDGTLTAYTSPGSGPDLRDAQQLVAGHNHFCALRTSHVVSCWGDNALGELGDGSAAPFSAVPTAVSDP